MRKRIPNIVNSDEDEQSDESYEYAPKTRSRFKKEPSKIKQEASSSRKYILQLILIILLVITCRAQMRVHIASHMAKLKKAIKYTFYKIHAIYLKNSGAFVAKMSKNSIFLLDAMHQKFPNLATCLKFARLRCEFVNVSFVLQYSLIYIYKSYIFSIERA